MIVYTTVIVFVKSAIQCPKRVASTRCGELHDKLDELQNIVKCQALIGRRELNVGLDDLLERSRDETGDKVVNLYRLIVNRVRKQIGANDIVRWVALLEDILELQRDIFNKVSPVRIGIELSCIS